MLPTKVERALLQHLEDFLGHLAAFHVFLAERYQTDRRILVAENMARINRAHECILKKMFRARIDVCAGVDQNKDVRLGWKHGRDAGAIDPRQRAQA